VVEDQPVQSDFKLSKRLPSRGFEIVVLAVNDLLSYSNLLPEIWFPAREVFATAVERPTSHKGRCRVFNQIMEYKNYGYPPSTQSVVSCCTSNTFQELPALVFSCS